MEIELTIDITDNTNILIKEELKDIYKMCITISKTQNAVISMFWFNYLNLLNLGIIDYIEENYNVELRKELRYKKAIKSIRGRTKSDELPFEKRYEKINTLNEQTHEDFINMSSFIKEHRFLKDLVDNLGVYYIDVKPIGNTFLFATLYKPLLKNKEELNQHLFDFGKEQGQVLSALMKCFSVEQNDNIDVNAFLVKYKDFNTTKNSNGLFKNDIDVNIGLSLLDMICKINYYQVIICNTLPSKSTLRYRLAYIIWDTIHSDISKMCDNEIFVNCPFNIKKYKDLIKGQQHFKNRNFRNCMFHYDIKNSINERYYNNKLMFLGLIQQEFSFSDNDYKIKIETALNNILVLLENDILKSQQCLNDF